MAVAQISASSCIELRSNPGYVLRKDAAQAWDRASAAFGKVVLITGAWRSYEIQERLFDGEKYPNQTPQYGRYSRGNLAGQRGYTSDVRWWPSKGSYWTRKEGTASAAVPGTSNHGGGIAVDVKTRRDDGDPPYEQAVVFGSWTDADRTAFLRVAAEHGWDDDEGREVNELWHLTYYPERDQHRGEVTPTTPNEETFMAALSEAKQNLMFTTLTGEIIPDGDRKLDLPNGVRVAIELARRQEKDNAAERTRERERAAAERQRDAAQQAQIAALTSAVQALATNANLDPAATMAMLKTAAEDALSRLTLTVTPEA